MTQLDTKSMKRPKILFFDVNETLLDLGGMKTSVAKALNGRADLLPLWFTTMLQYSLVDTVGDNYDDFGEIGAATMGWRPRCSSVTQWKTHSVGDLSLEGAILNFPFSRLE